MHKPADVQLCWTQVVKVRQAHSKQRIASKYPRTCARQSWGCQSSDSGWTSHTAVTPKPPICDDQTQSPAVRKTMSLCSCTSTGCPATGPPGRAAARVKVRREGAASSSASRLWHSACTQAQALSASRLTACSHTVQPEQLLAAYPRPECLSAATHTGSEPGAPSDPTHRRDCCWHEARGSSVASCPGCVLPDHA